MPLIITVEEKLRPLMCSFLNHVSLEMSLDKPCWGLTSLEFPPRVHIQFNALPVPNDLT